MDTQEVSRIRWVDESVLIAVMPTGAAERVGAMVLYEDHKVPLLAVNASQWIYDAEDTIVCDEDLNSYAVTFLPNGLAMLNGFRCLGDAIDFAKTILPFTTSLVDAHFEWGVTPSNEEMHKLGNYQLIHDAIAWWCSYHQYRIWDGRYISPYDEFEEED